MKKERLLTAGFRLNKAKCKFLQKCVTYLGHKIDGEGLHPTDDKLAAIRDAPRPKDVTALKSFLGLIMFYSRFMPHHSTILPPLHNLLKKDTPWKWSKVEEDAFVAAKDLILNSQTLVHCDHTLSLYLSCDASSYGAGAISTCGLCFMYPDCSSEKLLPNRKGDIQYNFWIETIPPVSVWSLIRNVN